MLSQTTSVAPVKEAKVSGAQGPQHEYQFLPRVASYSWVSYAVQVANEYYHGAKERSPLVKYGLEVAEGSLVKVGLPVVSTVVPYCEPLLTRADEFGCQQLNLFEKKILHPAVEAGLVEKVSHPLTTGKKIVQEKVLPPVISRYNAVVALPTTLSNKALDYAEGVVDHFLPPEEETAAQQPAGTAPQTPSARQVLSRTFKIQSTVSKRLQRKAFAKLNNLKLRSQEKLASMPYVVDLIEYSRKKIDTLSPSQLLASTRSTADRLVSKVEGYLSAKQERALAVARKVAATPYAQWSLAQANKFAIWAEGFPVVKRVSDKISARYLRVYNTLAQALAHLRTIKNAVLGRNQENTNVASSSSASGTPQTAAAKNNLSNKAATRKSVHDHALGSKEGSGPDEDHSAVQIALGPAKEESADEDDEDDDDEGEDSDE